MSNENTVTFGLCNVHYGVINKSDGDYTYDTPEHIPGAVSLTLNPTGDSTTFYADNGIYYAKNTNTGYTGTLTIANLPEKFRVDVLGEVLVDGGLLEKADAKQKDIALMFEVDGDEHADRFVYYDVTVGRPNQNAKTTEASISIEGVELPVTIKPRTTDKAVKYVTGANTPPEVYDNFYKSVYEPVIVESGEEND